MSSLITCKSPAYSEDQWKTVSSKPRHNKSDKMSQPKKQIDEKPPVFLNMKIIKLDINNTAIHPKVYNYITSLLSSFDDNDVIRKTLSIGISHSDKIIAIVQLFFVCVRRDKISIMQKIMDNRIISESDKHFIVNAYDRGYTPVMRAAYVGSSKAIKLLLHWGANPSPINIDGETIFDAIDAGLRDAIKANPLLEIFERPKFEEIRTYLKNVHSESLTNEVVIDTNLKKATIELHILNLNENIESQIDNLLISSVEDYNVNLLTQLFEDIKQLLTCGQLTKNVIDNIIDNYRDILQEEFPDEYAMLSA